MLGNGRDKDKLEKYAKSLGLDGSIHMPGRRSDIPQVMKTCDCFVMSSLAEGMPLSLLEAMSSGLPCLVTGVGGIPEVINSDDVGIVVESANADALADGMMRYVEMNDQMRSLLIEKARERVRTHFNHDVLLIKISELYENALKRS
jgi:glycosyltransferase involved in cell wall biosynthesis